MTVLSVYFSLCNDVMRCSLNSRSAADASDSSTSNGLHGRILSTFLNELDGIVSGPKSGEGSRDEGSQQVLVIAACQNVAHLDEALVRPGYAI